MWKVEERVMGCGREGGGGYGREERKYGKEERVW